MGLPFILILTAMIFLVAISGLSKSVTALKSRHLGWQKRTTPGFSRPLYVGAKSDAGLVTETTIEYVAIYPKFGGNRSPETTSAIVSGSWDHRQIKEFSDDPGKPHLFSLARIFSGSKETGKYIKMANKMIGVIGTLFGWGGSSLLENDEIRDAKRKSEGAERGVDDREKEMENKTEEEIEKRRKRIRELNREKEPLVKEKTIESQKLRDAEKALDGLRAEAREYRLRKPPQDVPESLKQKIKDKERDIVNHKNRIKELNDLIRPIDREIGIQEEEIRHLENTKG
jgi:hypothetical protein